MVDYVFSLPAYSPDGMHYAYCTRHNNRYYIIQNGKAQEYEYVFTQSLKFSEDNSLEYLVGRKYLYRVRHIPAD